MSATANQDGSWIILTTHNERMIQEHWTKVWQSNGDGSWIIDIEINDPTIQGTEEIYKDGSSACI